MLCSVGLVVFGFVLGVVVCFGVYYCNCLLIVLYACWFIVFVLLRLFVDVMFVLLF